MRIPFGILLTVGITGCAYQSQAIYQKAPTEPDSDQVISNASTAGDIFAMPRSKLLVDTADPQAKPMAPAPAGAPAAQAKGQGGGPTATPAPQATKSAATNFAIGKDTYSVSILPVESTYRYLVKPVTHFTSVTSVNITKIPNTDLPSSVAVEFTDNTKTRIDEIGGIIVAAIGLLPLAAASNADCAKGPKLEAFSLVINGEVNDATQVPGQPCWNYTVTFKEPAVGAVSWSRFERDARNPR